MRCWWQSLCKLRKLHPAPIRPLHAASTCQLPSTTASPVNATLKCATIRPPMTCRYQQRAPSLVPRQRLPKLGQTKFRLYGAPPAGFLLPRCKDLGQCRQMRYVRLPSFQIIASKMREDVVPYDGHGRRAMAATSRRVLATAIISLHFAYHALSTPALMRLPHPAFDQWACVRTTLLSVTAELYKGRSASSHPHSLQPTSGYIKSPKRRHQRLKRSVRRVSSLGCDGTQLNSTVSND